MGPPKPTKNRPKSTKNRLPTQKRGPQTSTFGARGAFRKTLKRALWSPTIGRRHSLSRPGHQHSGAQNTVFETACWTIGTASKVKRAPSGTGSGYKIEELYDIEVMIFRKRVTGKFKEYIKFKNYIILLYIAIVILAHLGTIRGRSGGIRGRSGGIRGNSGADSWQIRGRSGGDFLAFAIFFGGICVYIGVSGRWGSFLSGFFVVHWTPLFSCLSWTLFVWRGRFVNPTGDGPSTR
jgi:hypothetical protein